MVEAVPHPRAKRGVRIKVLEVIRSKKNVVLYVGQLLEERRDQRSMNEGMSVGYEK